MESKIVWTSLFCPPQKSSVALSASLDAKGGVFNLFVKAMPRAGLLAFGFY